MEEQGIAAQVPGVRRIAVGNFVLREDGKELIRYRQASGSVVVPDTVEKIAPFAFWSDRITQVSIPPSVRVIGERAFLWCRNLTEITLSEGLQEICSGAFCGCSRLKRIVLPESLRMLGPEAFDDTAITELTLPRGLERVARNALRGCKLRRLTILGKPALEGELGQEWDLADDFALVADAFEIEAYPKPYEGKHGLRGFSARWWAGESISDAVVERFRQYLLSRYPQFRTDRKKFRLMAVVGAIPEDRFEDALTIALKENDPILTTAVLSLRQQKQVQK